MKNTKGLSDNVLLLSVMGTGTRFVRDKLLQFRSNRHLHYFPEYRGVIEDCMKDKQYSRVVVPLRDPVLTLNSSAYRESWPGDARFRAIGQWTELAHFHSPKIIYIPVDLLQKGTTASRRAITDKVDPNIPEDVIEAWKPVRTPTAKADMTEDWLNQAIPKLRKIPGLVDLLKREGYKCNWFYSSLSP